MTIYSNNVRWLRYRKRSATQPAGWPLWAWLTAYTSGVVAATVGSYSLFQTLF